MTTATTQPEEFLKFLNRIPPEMLPNLWLIPLRANSKDPDIKAGEELKENQAYASVQTALHSIISGLVKAHREKEKSYYCAECNTKFTGRLAKCPGCKSEFDWGDS